jgi:SRSO17 transposase
MRTAHEQLKDELGLDHYEGRFWLGMHRHALLTVIALGYLQHRRLNSALKAGKNWHPVRHVHHRSHHCQQYDAP